MSPLPVSWLVGADDFATETQCCAGWTYFALTEQQAATFETAGRDLLRAHGLHSFHGNKFKDGHAEAYRAFLQVIRQALNDGGRACNTLANRSLWDELIGFAKRVTGEAIQKAVAGSEARAEAVALYAPILFTAFRVLRSLGPQVTIRLHLDDDTSLPNISESKTIAYPAGCSCQWLLQKAVNAYRKQQFPDAPRFGEYPVEKMKDGCSMLIQAADVLGNFSLAYVFTKLGHVSKKRKAKAQLLLDVFGNTIDCFNFSSHIDLHGNDFSLKEDGALTLQIRLVNGGE